MKWSALFLCLFLAIATAVAEPTIQVTASLKKGNEVIIEPLTVTTALGVLGKATSSRDFMLPTKEVILLGTALECTAKREQDQIRYGTVLTVRDVSSSVKTDQNESASIVTREIHAAGLTGSNSSVSIDCGRNTFLILDFKLNDPAPAADSSKK